jgi:hypothetical protein
MASATQKVRKIRANKKVSQGARRKREQRRDDRVKAAKVAAMLGLSTVGQLSAEETPKA